MLPRSGRRRCVPARQSAGEERRPGGPLQDPKPAGVQGQAGQPLATPPACAARPRAPLARLLASSPRRGPPRGACPSHGGRGRRGGRAGEGMRWVALFRSNAFTASTSPEGTAAAQRSEGRTAKCCLPWLVAQSRARRGPQRAARYGMSWCNKDTERRRACARRASDPRASKAKGDRGVRTRWGHAWRWVLHGTGLCPACSPAPSRRRSAPSRSHERMSVLSRPRWASGCLWCLGEGEQCSDECRLVTRRSGVRTFPRSTRHPPPRRRSSAGPCGASRPRCMATPSLSDSVALPAEARHVPAGPPGPGLRALDGPAVLAPGRGLYAGCSEVLQVM